MKMSRYSLELTRRVWISTLPPGINKMVLLAYCLHVNDHTGVCWPSVSRLAAMTGMAPRTVQRHIRALEAAGILKAHSATAITRVYKLSLHGLTECPALMKPVADVPGDIFDTDPVDNFAQWGDIFDTDPCQFVQKGVAICTETPVRMSPKLYELNRTDEGTDHAAPTPTASPASRSSATPPVLVDQEKTEAQTLARFAALHQRKGYGPVTDATLDKLKAEGELAGLTLPQVLAHCVERRWGTFRALWLQTPSPTRKSGPVPPSGAWTVPSDAPATGGQRTDLSPEARAAQALAARYGIGQSLADTTQHHPCPDLEQVANHKAKLAELRASIVAGMAGKVHGQSARAARVAMH